LVSSRAVLVETLERVEDEDEAFELSEVGDEL
jgi:hypothetical protein